MTTVGLLALVWGVGAGVSHALPLRYAGVLILVGLALVIAPFVLPRRQPNG